MSQLTQSVRLIATAFVPDRKLGDLDVGKKYGLILLGDCLYIVIFRNPDIAKDKQSTFLNGEPVNFIVHLPGEPSSPNEHGYLYFREEDEHALAWFTEYFTDFGGTITLVLEQ